MSGGKEVTCTHRIKMGDSEQWHYISQQCRDRVRRGGGGGRGRDGRGGDMYKEGCNTGRTVLQVNFVCSYHRLQLPVSSTCTLDIFRKESLNLMTVS